MIPRVNQRGAVLVLLLLSAACTLPTLALRSELFVLMIFWHLLAL
jgi:hypothetical protein